MALEQLMESLLLYLEGLLHFLAETLGYRLLPELRVQLGGDLAHKYIPHALSATQPQYLKSCKAHNLQALWSCMSSDTFHIRYDPVHGTRVSWLFLAVWVSFRATGVFGVPTDSEFQKV